MTRRNIFTKLFAACAASPVFAEAKAKPEKIALRIPLWSEFVQVNELSRDKEYIITYDPRVVDREALVRLSEQPWDGPPVTFLPVTPSHVRHTFITQSGQLLPTEYFVKFPSRFMVNGQYDGKYLRIEEILD